MGVKKSRAVRSRLGAAYVQALVVSLVMIVTFACILMFARTYDAKIAAGQQARAAAWSAGVGGCPPAREAAINRTAKLPNASVQGADSNGIAGAFFKVTPKRLGAGDTAALAPKLLGGQSIPFRTVTQFACNEEPDTRGDLGSAAGWMFDFVKDVFVGG